MVTTKISRYIRSIVMDIMPSTDYWKLLLTGSDTQRLKSDMFNISIDINSLIITIVLPANIKKHK